MSNQESNPLHLGSAGDRFIQCLADPQLKIVHGVFGNVGPFAIDDEPGGVAVKSVVDLLDRA